MKKLSFLAMAAAGLLFTACSSDDAVKEVAPVLTANGAGYVGISITLPTADNTTRANDDFTNGRADEFEVKNAYLLLFKGTDESDATFVKTYSLTNDWKDDTKNASETGEGEDVNVTDPQTGVTFEGGTGVTQTSVSVCKIDKLTLTEEENLFGYVIINAQGGLAASPAVGTPFTEFAKKELDAADRGGDLQGNIGANGLLMTNSPISDKPAGSDPAASETIKTLMPLDKAKIKNTSDEAKAAPAGCIYVERAAAKVTVSNGIAESDMNITLGEETLAYTIDGWQVFNTEPKFYNARQIEKNNDGAWFWDVLKSQYCDLANTKYRFITLFPFNPSIPEGGTHTVGYRTYFAKDIQYDADATLDNRIADAEGTWNGLTDRAFVPENTFDVDRQMRKNTTQVAVRLQFNDGTDFYTISDDASYYLSTTVGPAIAAKVELNYDVNKFKNDLAAAAAAYLQAQAKANNETKWFTAAVAISAEVTTTTASNDAKYTVSYTLTTQVATTNPEEGGTYSDCTAPTLEELEADDATIEWEAVDLGWETVKAAAEKLVTVKLYKDGLSYYNVRIKHFGDVETPWSAERATQPGTEIWQIYGPEETRTADYLGRYGVVRDNWYNLRIEAVAKLGSAEPIPVEDDTTPDDDIEEEYYISAHVHILPWVLRTQSVQF